MKAASTNGANALQVEPVTGGPIGEAAAKFSEATYPLASKIDWGNSQQIAKYLSEARGETVGFGVGEEDVGMQPWGWQPLVFLISLC